MQLERLDANVRQHKGPPALLGFQFLENQFLADALQLLADLDLARLELETDLDTALSKSEIVVLLTDHAPFRSIDRARLAGKSVIDTRGIWR